MCDERQGLILVIDAGTSGMRGILFDERGQELSSHRAVYSPRYIDGITVEQDPAEFLDALLKCARAAAGFSAEEDHIIRAVGLTCQRSSVIPVDKEGRALHPAIMWQDSRCQGIVEELSDRTRALSRKTGARLNTVYAAAKMAWLRQNFPEIYQRAYRILTIADFMTFHMTGRFVTDETYVCRTFLGDLKTCRWDDELLSLFGIEREKLCEIIPPGGISGRITKEFAEATGLPEGTPVISCGGDQQCAAVGLGVIAPGRAEITVGTGAFILGCVRDLPASAHGEIVVERHALPGAYALECSMPSCAALYNWVNRELFTGEDLQRINEMVAAVPAGANGILALPYFQGRGTPDWDPGAKGAFLNLSLSATRADMARALLESIAYEVAENLDILAGYMELPDTLSISGGLSRFETFDRILADSCGRPVIRTEEETDQTAMGGFVSTACALGLYPSFGEAYREMTRKAVFQRYDPDASAWDLHLSRRKKMRESYHSLGCLSKDEN